MKRKLQAFTLIEMLISIAIIAIMTTGALSLIIAPLREQTRADRELSMRAGCTTAIAALTADIHGTHHIVPTKSGYIVGRAAYHVDDSGILRRQVVTPEERQSFLDGSTAQYRQGAALVSSVSTFSIDVVEGRASVTLIANEDVLQEPLRSENSFTLALGALGGRQ